MEWREIEEGLKVEFEREITRLDDCFKKQYISRVQPHLVSDVIVKAYDSEMKLSELSNITIPAARTIVIKPYDPSTINEMLKALNKQKPEFSPILQSDQIKISLNPPTEETRKKAVKESKDYLEQSKIRIRNIRKDFMKKIKDGELPEDQEKKMLNSLEQSVKEMNSKLDEMFSIKEKELMSI